MESLSRGRREARGACSMESAESLEELVDEDPQEGEQDAFELRKVRRRHTQLQKERFNAKRLASSGVAESDIHELRAIFELWDSGGTGVIHVATLKEKMESLGNTTTGIERMPAFQIIRDIGKRQEIVTFEEFVAEIGPLLQEKDSEEDVRRVWRLFDEDRIGSVNVHSLERIARELNVQVSTDEIADMIDRADSNGDGEVTFEDFYAVLTKKQFR